MTELRTNADFLAAYQARTPVEVWFDDELCCTAPIEQLGLMSLKIHGEHYVIKQCHFFIHE